MATTASDSPHMRNRAADVESNDDESDTESVESSTSDCPSSVFDDTPDPEPEMSEEFDALRERRVTAWRRHYVVVLCITAGFFLLMNFVYIPRVFVDLMQWLLGPERSDSYAKSVGFVVGRTRLMMLAVWRGSYSGRIWMFVYNELRKSHVFNAPNSYAEFVDFVVGRIWLMMVALSRGSYSGRIWMIVYNKLRKSHVFNAPTNTPDAAIGVRIFICRMYSCIFRTPLTCPGMISTNGSHAIWDQPFFARILKHFPPYTVIALTLGIIGWQAAKRLPPNGKRFLLRLDIILCSIGMSLFDLKFWKDQHHIVFWKSTLFGLLLAYGLSLLLTGVALYANGLKIWRGMPVPWNGTEPLILMPPAVLLETASFRTPRLLGVRLQTRKLPLWKLFRIWYFATIALSIVNIIIVVPVVMTGQIALNGHVKEARREFIASQIQVRREFMFSQIQGRGLMELEEGSGATVISI